MKTRFEVCQFQVGQLVTCPGPFNSGQDAQGHWRRVEVVTGTQWDPPISHRDQGFWRVYVQGYSGRQDTFHLAPRGARAGDIIRPVGYAWPQGQMPTAK